MRFVGISQIRNTPFLFTGKCSIIALADTEYSVLQMNNNYILYIY